MTSGDLTELESGHVFRMRSVHDIFRKLNREKQRFKNAGSNREGRVDQADAVINFAIMAWHMTDWVWDQQKHKLLEYFDVSSLSEFQDEMRRQCPGLAVCDVIANAAKHGGAAYKRENRPEIETVLVAHPVAKGAESVELLALLEDRRWSLKIKVNGTPEHPLVLMERVFLFWHRFIQQHCVAKQPS